jgi:hypothetical protein
MELYVSHPEDRQHISPTEDVEMLDEQTASVLPQPVAASSPEVYSTPVHLDRADISIRHDINSFKIVAIAAQSEYLSMRLPAVEMSRCHEQFHGSLSHGITNAVRHLSLVMEYY